MEKIKNICNIISSGLDAKTVIGFMNILKDKGGMNNAKSIRV